MLIEACLGELSSGADLALDLSAVDFMDASGVGALVTIAAAAQHEGRTFEVTATSVRANRVLEITGLAGRWSPVAT